MVIIMYLFKKKKNEQMMISRINEIISGSGYQLVLYKKDYKHFGNSIIKFVCSGKMNIKIILPISFNFSIFVLFYITFLCCI